MVKAAKTRNEKIKYLKHFRSDYVHMRAEVKVAQEELKRAEKRFQSKRGKQVSSESVQKAHLKLRAAKARYYALKGERELILNETDIGGRDIQFRCKAFRFKRNMKDVKSTKRKKQVLSAIKANDEKLYVWINNVNSQFIQLFGDRQKILDDIGFFKIMTKESSNKKVQQIIKYIDIHTLKTEDRVLYSWLNTTVSRAVNHGTGTQISDNDWRRLTEAGFISPDKKRVST